ncbi:hypothetical protein ACFQZC_09045 [Streptacidiphilus monticola]
MWIGSGLGELGLVAGESADPAAARALMDGRDCRTVSRWYSGSGFSIRAASSLPISWSRPSRRPPKPRRSRYGEYLGGALAKRLVRAERGIVRDSEKHLAAAVGFSSTTSTAGTSWRRPGGG